jgi:hypothetical protein
MADQVPWDDNKRHNFDPSTVGVLLTAHPRQQMFWEEALPNWTDSPFYVLLGYDDVDCEKIKKPLEKFPGVKDCFATGHRYGHVKGELLQMKMGAKILAEKGFQYMLKSAADYNIYPMGLEHLWRALELQNHTTAHDGPTGGQILHLGTNLVFGFTNIIYAMMQPLDLNHRYGAAERFFNRRRLILNVVRAGFEGGKAGVEAAIRLHHAQGQYAHDHHITIQDTWDLGEIWK